eukprot:7327372-Prymnesium_polylepis.2
MTLQSCPSRTPVSIRIRGTPGIAVGGERADTHTQASSVARTHTLDSIDSAVLVVFGEFGRVDLVIAPCPLSSTVRLRLFLRRLTSR